VPRELTKVSPALTFTPRTRPMMSTILQKELLSAARERQLDEIGNLASRLALCRVTLSSLQNISDLSPSISVVVSMRDTR
jgi:hypothetical protein